MKKLIVIASLIIVILAAFLGYRHWQKPQVIRSASAVAVNAAQAKTMDMPQNLQAIGSLRARQSIDVSSEIAGKITKIAFKDGQRVKKNQVLVTLDDQLDKDSLKAAQLALKLSKDQYNRYLKLAQKQAVSVQALEEKKNDYLSKQVAVSQAKTTLSKTVIRAPFTGSVTTNTYDVGQYIKPGDTLTTLVNRDTLRATFSVPERFSHQLKLGQAVTVTSNIAPGTTFTGKIIYVSPKINKQTRTIQEQALITNQNNQLSPGGFVHVNQILGAVKQATVIPERALVPSIAGPQVFVIKNQRVQRINVSVAYRQGRWVQVTKGISVGQWVVTAGQNKLQSGALVAIQKG